MPDAAPSPALPDLPRSVDACRSIARASRSSFLWGMRLTPEPRRTAMFAVYAWTRAADDLVDNLPSPPRPADLDRAAGALEDFRLRTREVIDASIPPPDDAGDLWPAFAWACRSFPIKPAWLEEFLEGMAEDLRHTGYPTEADVDRYCRRAASMVGRVCVAVWGLSKKGQRDPGAAYLKADRLGLAFQRTNILRDFTEDYDRIPRRVYIAHEVFDRFGLNPDLLRKSETNPRAEVLMRHAAGVAREHFEAAAGLEDLIAPDCRPVLRTLTRTYSELLSIIERFPSRPLRTRVRLATHRKLWIAVREYLAPGKDPSA
jgi:phytoene synthase